MNIDQAHKIYQHRLVAVENFPDEFRGGYIIGEIAVSDASRGHALIRLRESFGVNSKLGFDFGISVTRAAINFVETPPEIVKEKHV